MKKIIVASKNPVKMNGALSGFQKMFPGENFEIFGVDVPSGVSGQPMTDADTFLGAKNRAEGASAAEPAADFCVGIEAGIEEHDSHLGTFSWVVVRDKNGKIGKARSNCFFLPPKINELIKQGKELGEAADIVFDEKNSKQKGGTIGILTDGLVDRAESYITTTIYALIPFKKPELY